MRLAQLRVRYTCTMTWELQQLQPCIIRVKGISCPIIFERQTYTVERKNGYSKVLVVATVHS